MGTGQNADIVVEGYTPRFVAACGTLLGTEGGEVDDAADHGGATKNGISLRFLVAEGKIDLDHDGLADFDLDMDGDIDGADIHLLSHGDCEFLYWRCFWQKLEAESFAKPIGEMLFDQGVNGGNVAAKKMLQRAINALGVLVSDVDRLAVDGQLGPRTRLTMGTIVEHPGIGMAGLVEAYREAVRNRYRAIASADPSQKRYLRGWLARAERLGS